MSNFQTERSPAGTLGFVFTRMLRQCLIQCLTLLLVGSLVFAALPRTAARAQTRPSEQSLSSLIGLLREAESLARVEIVRSELKEIREAANRASKVDPSNPAALEEIQLARTMLRRIIDDPRGESADFQEKIANSLKLLEDYAGLGDGDGLRVRTDTAFGLITTTFDTLNGTVSVNLPDDLAAGDTISGTVIAEPKGSTKEEQAKNEDSLNGYVVEVARQETPKQQTQGSKWVIPPATQVIPVVLKTRQGKEVARTQVPVMHGQVSKPKTEQMPNGDLQQPGNYSTPQFGQAGRPVSVAGPFDGDFNNTAVKLGNNTAQFLAESPRKVVVRSPANLIGRATIEVNEQNRVVANCSYQSVGIKLAADKLNLIRGEQTTLSATVSGLAGVTSTVSVLLTNATPWTVRMEGGEKQLINVNPGEFNGDTFTTKRTLTGVRAGGFSINAVVDPIRSERANCTPGTARNTPYDLPGERPPGKRVDSPKPADDSKLKPGDLSKLDDARTKPPDRPKPDDDPKLKWQLVNPYGIDVGAGSFHAGRTLDVLMTKGGGVLAASETGGVWLLPPSGSGIPLSRDWENTEVNCLAFGPDGEGHVYAGLNNIGGSTTLRETDTSKPVALRLVAPWMSIPLPSAVGSIYQIAVVSSSRLIVLACDGGVYWSFIPAAGGKYAWTRAEGLPDGRFFSVAEAKGGGLVAGAWGNSDLTDRNGIFVGRLNSPGLGESADLVMHRAIVTGFDAKALLRVSVDSCATDRKSVYAMSVGTDRVLDIPAPPYKISVETNGVLNAILRSDDGGETWRATKANYASESGVFPKGTLLRGELMGDETAGGVMHRLKVSPVNPNTLSVTGMFAYISRDNGDTWYILGDQSWNNLHSLHGDVHEVEFDPNDPTGKSLVVASDGGVAVSTDLGNSWTDLNEKYASLQLYGTGSRGFYGCGAISPNVYGEGTQDNGNIYTELDGAAPWKKLDGGDGGQWHSLRVGGFIRSNMNSATIWRGTWNASKKVVEQAVEIPVRVGGRDVTGTTVGLVAANVNSPAHHNGKGQTMYTVGALGGRIHGLFANDDGGDMHWEQLSDWVAPLEQIVAAVGSATGEKIYLSTFGPQGVQMYMVTTETGSVSPMGPLPPPLRPTTSSGVDPKARVHRFVVLNDENAFALYTTDQVNSGFLLKTADGGTTWEIMPAPSKGLTSIELDWTTGAFYLSDTDHVYISRNNCKTWTRASIGLPQHCQGIDLRFVAQPDGKNFLYLATYGWSLWRVQTNP